ncbi:potassium channel subfamily K member 13-like [Macrosteles quadrilineatus]|uniref:potassium channel subfamily K member 13-like n=1 Tax=Macrosteles quadrilineatus TaxID=74068 RepID=UPI0023E1C71D|nr:potassium channel subfamily K member 13-like [Macrosteles quadrilineatus]
MGWLSVIQLSEDNARVVLLAIVLLLYMVMGALLFQQLESSTELAVAGDYAQMLAQVRAALDNTTLDNATLDRLLDLHSTVTSGGGAGRRWDFAGSFHFVSTIVSTIGYGNTTPQTVAGRIAVIAYGFLGCSSGILFFNLFLERIITLLAYILRAIYLRKLSKEGQDVDEDDSLDEWKPSVYWVMLCLVVASVVVAGCASALYCPLENWTFFESIYFCFVSFATIGFGDYVSTQGPQRQYPYPELYRVANFILIVLGCCCIYSLFNVTSIVVKQALNWVILHLDCQCCDRQGKAGRMLRRHSLRLQQRRRSSITYPRSLRKSTRTKRSTPMCDVVAETDSAGYDSEAGVDSRGRRLSGELISMKDFLTSNKVSLAVMQKQLYETAMMQRGYTEDNKSTGKFTPGSVGPLAIVTQKLGDTSSAR